VLELAIDTAFLLHYQMRQPVYYAAGSEDDGDFGRAAADGTDYTLLLLCFI